MTNSGYELVVLEGRDKGKVFPLKDKEITLGRKAEDAEEEKPGLILFEDPTVSRVHAMLLWDSKADRFLIQHKSKTNATVINGKAITKHHVVPGDQVKMGNLIFTIRPLPETKEREIKGLWNSVQFKPGEESEEVNTGFIITVTGGSDKGKVFRLNRNVMAIGCKQPGFDLRRDKAVLLNDSSLKAEEALLVWRARLKKYGIFKAEKSSTYVKVYRDFKGMESRIEVKSDLQNLVREGDIIVVGSTIMEVRRESAPLEKFKGKMIPLEKQAGPREPAPPEKKGAKPEPSIEEKTFKWKPAGDFVLEISSGKDKGTRYTFISSSLSEGRVITIGKSGKRENEIEIADDSIDNEQANLIYSKGKFRIANKSADVKIKVNGKTLSAGEEEILKSGAAIKIGESQLNFLERKVAEALDRYEIEVIKGTQSEIGRKFPLSRDHLKIGRGRDCDLKLANGSVSRLHASIAYRDGKFYIEHKSKSNPTFLNGISIPEGKERVLKAGDEIQLSGETVLKLREKAQ